MLPTIIIICYIYVIAGARPLGKGGCTKMLLYMRTLCKYNAAELRDIQKRYKRYVREPYKIYEMYKRYKMYEMYEEYEVENIRNSTVFVKELV